MKYDDVRALPDSELEQVIAWTQEEKKARAEKRKQEAIAAIREIAAREHIPMKFDGQRGRPTKPTTADETSPAKPHPVSHPR